MAAQLCSRFARFNYAIALVLWMCVITGMEGGGGGGGTEGWMDTLDSGY